MSNVIKFLEKIAVSATLMDDDAWKRELSALDIAPELESAILNKDQTTIEKLLGTNTNLIAGIFPAEDDEPAEEDEPEEDTPKEDKKEVKRMVI